MLSHAKTNPPDHGAEEHAEGKDGDEERKLVELSQTWGLGGL